MVIIDRSGWGAKPPESVTPWNVADLDGICQHWFGSPKAAATHAGCDDLLRSVQRTHQAGEYSDIAYNFGVCPHGVAYKLRGWNVQTGANGTSDANRRFLAIVYMAGTSDLDNPNNPAAADPLTVKAKAALEALYAEAFKKGVAVNAITHGSITGSACPGPAVKPWLASGAWKPKPEAQRVRFELYTGEGKKLHESALAPSDRASQLARLEKFDNATREIRLNEMDHDRGKGEPEDIRTRRVWEP